MSDAEKKGSEKKASQKSQKKKWTLRIFTKKGALRVTILFVLLTISAYGGKVYMIGMPGKSYQGELPPLTKEEKKTRDYLRDSVKMMAQTIGERNYFNYTSLERCRKEIESEFKGAGYQVNRQSYKVKGKTFYNLEAVLKGGARKDEIVVIGAHYDSVYQTPGANDNASGVASLLYLARSLAKSKPERTLRFVAFVNEEPPDFQTETMGSLVYARKCKKDKDNITAMLSLETMGYYSDKEGSQKFPSPLLRLVYPDKGNFISFVGNLSSRSLVRNAVGTFRKKAKFPSEGAVLPGFIAGVGWSDHWSFWQVGYPGLMVTDTAPFRYPHYHKSTDTIDKIDFDRLARVVVGLEGVIKELAGISKPAGDSKKKKS